MDHDGHIAPRQTTKHPPLLTAVAALFVGLVVGRITKRVRGALH